MSHRSHRAWVLSVLTAFLFVAVVPGIANAADNASLQEFLAAGEFAPAITLAEQLPDRAQRDAAMAQIARAQGAAGARSASYATLANVGNDTQRSDVLNDLRETPAGGRGGGVIPDFESLIELVTSTISPTTWSDVGGPGAVKKFVGGVYVDANGQMRRIERTTARELAEMREAAAAVPVSASNDPRKESTLRKVSLPRLERAVQLRLASGREIDDEMQLLAGLERVQYVFVYPSTGDIVLAGPAGAWQPDREGRWASARTGRPVLRLDDLVVLLRHMRSSPNGQFGCSIMPTQDGLARTQAFLDHSARSPLKAGTRETWIEELRSQLGAQTIEVIGLDPRTRVAQVLVEADYRMKMVGIGLEPGSLDVPSYLDMIHVAAGQAPPPMNVLRWWFTMDYKALEADPEHQAFALSGQGVKVLSDNEMLAKDGQHAATGTSDTLNREFAHNFTKHFEKLAEKYPIYAELQNIFDMALVAAVMKNEGLAETVGWHMNCFASPEAYPVTLGSSPKTVDTVVNHRVVNRVHILAAVSGGVSADPKVYARSVEVERNGNVYGKRRSSAPDEEDLTRWWWD
ncbi:MAG TPA: DUF1598 domain-containing protein [Pirellulales bacterium]|nr:DUF1598 domain-containing protein [Pirellulales bacterium]